MRLRTLDVISVALFLNLVTLLFDFRSFPYADDWTYVTPLTFIGGLDLVRWAFTSHVDHLIPLQKLAHYLVLSRTGYDFRIPVLLNSFCALLITVMLTRIALLVRGKILWGDLFIPLLVLNPTFGYALWAFQFQFLSSIFFIVAFMLCALLFHRNKNGIFIYIGIFMLGMAALCGMNGLLFSITVAIGCVIWYYIGARSSVRLRPGHVWAMVALVCVQLTILAKWSPSDATETTFQPVDALVVFFGLQASAFSTYSFAGPFLLSLILFVPGVTLIPMLCRIWSADRGALPASLIAIVYLSTQTVILSIALGRSGVQGGWNNGLIMHYGFLTVLLPVTVWLGASLKLSSRGGRFLACTIVVLLGCAVYIDGWEWRRSHNESVYQRQQAIAARLNLDPDLGKIVDDHITDFYWRSDSESKKPVLRGLEVLRNENFAHYKLAPLER